MLLIAMVMREKTMAPREPQDRFMVTIHDRVHVIHLPLFMRALKPWRQRQQPLPVRMQHVYTTLRRRFVQQYGLQNWQYFLQDHGL